MSLSLPPEKPPASAASCQDFIRLQFSSLQNSRPSPVRSSSSQAWKSFSMVFSSLALSVEGAVFFLTGFFLAAFFLVAFFAVFFLAMASIP
ncbi:MAG: hypothetical protein OSB39_11445 [Opitutales bacterium]|nr:hypothetical protein [Opitutales bacterium]